LIILWAIITTYGITVFISFGAVNHPVNFQAVFTVFIAAVPSPFFKVWWVPVRVITWIEITGWNPVRIWNPITLWSAIWFISWAPPAAIINFEVLVEVHIAISYTSNAYFNFDIHI